FATVRGRPPGEAREPALKAQVAQQREQAAVQHRLHETVSRGDRGMNVRPLPQPRRFDVGGVELAHVADVELDYDELITFRTGSGSEYDVVRKPWGYYPLPSLNRRLPSHGLRPLLARTSDGRI